MKIVLVNPPRLNSISSEVPTTVNAETNTIPPLGLMYLEAYLHAHSQHETVILDSLAEHWDHSQLKEQIAAHKPDLVGITGHTHDLIDMIKASRSVKELSPEIKVCWGGPHVSDFPRQTMAYPEVDMCIPFEGEEALCELADTLASHGDLSQVRGLYYKDASGQTQVTPARPAIQDLDALPFPRRDQLDFRKYSYVLGSESIATSLITSRGCPYKCTFCNTPNRNSWRCRGAQSIVNEMEECARLGIREIYMTDDTFNVQRQRTLDICREILKRDLKVNWNFRARVNLITADTMELCRQAGCTRVHVGVESGSDEGMATLQKHLTTDQVRKGFKILKDSGMTTVCYFMIGCPHEKTKDDIKRTIDFAIELDPDYVLFGVLTPYPNTAIYDDGVRKGLLDPDHWEKFLAHPTPDFKPQVWTEYFTAEELGEMCDMAFKRFYIRPKQMFRKLMEVSSLSDFGRKFKAGWEIFKL